MTKLLAFVAIVWTVAASFVAFELLSLKGVALMLAYPAVFDRLLLSGATQRSKACVVESGEAAPPRAQGIRPAEANAGAWFLGLSIGRDAVARQSTTIDPQILAASKAGMDRIAGLLGVKAPDVFTPRQFADANTEFLDFVEADAVETAHELAVRYSPQACQLYKLGAFWGFSSMFRVALPGERSVFSTEIRHYARQLQLPEPLWRPMTEKTASETPRDRIDAETTALTDGITRYLTSRF